MSSSHTVESQTQTGGTFRSNRERERELMTNPVLINLWTTSVANELSNYSSVAGRV